MKLNNKTVSEKGWYWFVPSNGHFSSCFTNISEEDISKKRLPEGDYFLAIIPTEDVTLERDLMIYNHICKNGGFIYDKQ